MTRTLLDAYFRPHNARLYALLAAYGIPFTPWEDDGDLSADATHGGEPAEGL
jgi:hypothetical protein